MDNNKLNLIKRDIFDGFKMMGLHWAGNLSDVDFLSRIYDLTALPSNDERFNNMQGDIWQHRINNDDWDQWWVLDDARLLLNDYTYLKKFIEATTHPLVCPDTDIALEMVNHVNGVMESVGIGEKLICVKNFMSKPIFEFRKQTTSESVVLDQEKIINNSFIREQINKCKEKLDKGDNDGVITNARSLVEGVLNDIHERILGCSLQETGDLTKDFKKIQKILNLAPEQHSDDAVKGIISGLSSMLQNLDTVSNKMGDRHRPRIEAKKHHAKLCSDAALAVTDFLYSSLIFQYGTVTDLYLKLIETLDSELRLIPYEELIQQPQINSLIRRLDGYTSRILIQRLLADYIIPTLNGYRHNDIFFAALLILIESLTQKDVDLIYQKYKDNNQAVGLPNFMEILRKRMTK